MKKMQMWTIAVSMLLYGCTEGNGRAPTAMPVASQPACSAFGGFEARV